MRLGRLWWLLRYNLQRGWDAAWGEYMVARQISEWENPCGALPVEKVPLHVVCGSEHVMMLQWMLASWFVATRRNWKVIVHDDGSLHRDHFDLLVSRFPHVEIHWRGDADRAMGDRLKAFPRCANYRHRMPQALKCFDVGWMTPSPDRRFLLLDPDIIFFRKPNRILAWCDAELQSGRPISVWFNEDAQEPAPFGPADTPAELGFRIWPRVNSGLCLLDASLIDLDFCEYLLNLPAMQDCVDWRLEQTLLALLASRRNVGGLLPRQYEVSLGRHRQEDSVARHYVGAVRGRFWAEGVNTAAALLKAASG